MTPIHIRTRILATALALASAGAGLSGCRAACDPVDPITAAQDTSTTAPTETSARVLRRPVLRLVEHGAWGPPLQQAGVPTFSLYEDGLVVWADGTGADARAMQARLSPDEVAALVDIANAKIGELPPQVSLNHTTDQPAATIGVTHNGRIYSVNVYGFSAAGQQASDAAAPEGFADLHRILQSFTHDEAEPWQPDEIEVVLWRQDALADEAKPWPEMLPAPPTDAREPRPRIVGRSGKTIQQAIRYRIAGDLEAELGDVLGDPEEPTAFAWRGSAWTVRTERVLPARTFYW